MRTVEKRAAEHQAVTGVLSGMYESGWGETSSHSKVRVSEIVKDSATSVGSWLGSSGANASDSPILRIAAAVHQSALVEEQEHERRDWHIDDTRESSVGWSPSSLKGVKPASTHREFPSSWRLISWEQFLDSARRKLDLTNILREFGRHQVANRIDYLDGLHADDPEEPILDFASLRTFVGYIISEPKLPDPDISLSPDGLAIGEWMIEPDGLIAMEFRAFDWIRFACIGRRPRPTVQRRRLSGTMEKQSMREVIRKFTCQLGERS